jgi:hypothetical protein
MIRVPARGRLAQLVRAPALQAGGRRFEPCTAHQTSSYPSVSYVQFLSGWQLWLISAVPNFVPTQT